MAKEDKKALVPKLRFPEFRDPWDKKALAPYLEECGFKVSATTSLPIYSSSRSGLTPQASYYDGRTIINDGEYGVVPPNCFVYRHMSDDGQFAFNVNETGGEIAVSKEYPVFRTINLDSRFLRAKLNHSQDFKAFALSQKAGGTRTRLYFSKLRSWETYLPSLAEQQKIADCLNSLDELIAAQGRKVEALMTYKRGLMQQLFPREGEIFPRLRFPEFRDAPEWEEATIGSRSKSFSGGTPDTSNKSYYGGEIPFIRSAEIGKSKTELSLTELGLKNSAAKLVEPGDVLVALYGANSGDVALAKLGGAINQAILCLRPDGDRAFLHHFLTAKKDWILATFIQGGQGNLSGEIIKSTSLRFPSKEEQAAVAACLSSIDARIVLENEIFEVLRVNKKGLVQQLFPSLVEA